MGWKLAGVDSVGERVGEWVVFLQGSRVWAMTSFIGPNLEGPIVFKRLHWDWTIWRDTVSPSLPKFFLHPHEKVGFDRQRVTLSPSTIERRSIIGPYSEDG
jgi:hypothetical protein